MKFRWRRFLKEGIPRWTGIHVYHTLPQGVDLFVDVKRLLPQFTANVVFDVGANIGQSAKGFARHFRHAQIYCFEPVSQTFAKLQRNIRGFPNIQCYNQALGNTAGTVTMSLSVHSEASAIVDGSTRTPEIRGLTEDVQIGTLQSFCETHRIERIDFLKIDTEGHDLKVLEGGADLLDNAQVSMIQVEAGMNPRNDLHVPFQELAEYIERCGYYLFGIYEQTSEFMKGQPQMRRSNPVFISKHLASVGAL